MKVFRFLAVITLTLCFATGCVVKDIPSVSFSNEEFPVAQAGGDFIIPVSSTGVSNVVVHYGNGNGWTLEENGDRIPNEWCKVVRLIEHYETRELASWQSGVEIHVEPNESGSERTAQIEVKSFGASDFITVRQGW
ncbi:MAG: BACON domain-containing protein [Alistipes sp.]|nr:BACON domain-containing protein [Alistipes sp.]